MSQAPNGLILGWLKKNVGQSRNRQHDADCESGGVEDRNSRNRDRRPFLGPGPEDNL